MVKSKDPSSVQATLTSSPLGAVRGVTSLSLFTFPILWKILSGIVVPPFAAIFDLLQTCAIVTFGYPILAAQLSLIGLFKIMAFGARSIGLPGLNRRFTKAKEWVAKYFSLQALGYLANKIYLWAEERLFKFGAKNGIAVALITIGLMMMVLFPLTVAGGTLVNYLSLGWLNGTLSGLAAFVSLNVAALALPKIKMFLSPIYMGCISTLLNTKMGERVLLWFEYVGKLSLFKQASQQRNAAYPTILFNNRLSRVWDNKTSQRVVLGAGLMLALSPLSIGILPILITGLAIGGVVSARFGLQIINEKLRTSGFTNGTNGTATDASTSLGNLLQHTLQTYTFSYYFNKYPDLKKLFDGSRPAMQRMVHNQSASDMVSLQMPVLPAKQSEAGRVLAWCGDQARALTRSIIYFHSGLIAAATTVAPAKTIFTNLLGITLPLGQAFESVVEKFSGEKLSIANEIGKGVAGIAAAPFALLGFVGGTYVARESSRRVLRHAFRQGDLEICMAYPKARDAEARLISDGAITGLICAGLFLSGVGTLWVLSAWAASAALSAACNQTDLVTPRAKVSAQSGDHGSGRDGGGTEVIPEANEGQSVRGPSSSFRPPGHTQEVYRASWRGRPVKPENIYRPRYPLFGRRI